MSFLESFVVLLSAAFLAGSLVYGARIIPDLPSRVLQGLWAALVGVNWIVVVGYLVVGLARPELSRPPSPLVVTILAAAAGLVALVNLIAVASFRAARNRGPRTESVIDSMMGLYERRFWERRLAEEFSRARRYEMALCVLRIDVDDFASINEIHGRQIGDQVLNWLGKLLLDSLRQEDVAGRFGGEEVVVLALNTDLPGATNLAQRLRRTIEAFEFVAARYTPDNKPLRCTVSVGVAALGGGMTDPDRLLAAARDALVQAKSAGRNRVVVFEANDA